MIDKQIEMIAGICIENWKDHIGIDELVDFSNKIEEMILEEKKHKEDNLLKKALWFMQSNNTSWDEYYEIEQYLDYYRLISNGYEIATFFKSRGVSFDDVKEIAESVGLKPKSENSIIFEPNVNGLAWKLLSIKNKEKIRKCNGKCSIRLEPEFMDSYVIYINENIPIFMSETHFGVIEFAKDLGLEINE